MAKSVYSLVLSDDIVAAVDVLAAKEGYSRSALVNHVLAQHVRLPTAEALRRQMTADLLLALDGTDGLHLRGQLTQGGALLLRTALHYKYNPQLSYTVEMWGESGAPYLGQLKVALRSQNSELLSCFGVFWELWRALEAKHLAVPPAHGEQKTREKQYRRTLRRPEALAADAAVAAVAAYIAALNSSLDTFFRHVDEPEKAARQTERAYLAALEQFGEAALL